MILYDSGAFQQHNFFVFVTFRISDVKSIRKGRDFRFIMPPLGTKKGGIKGIKRALEHGTANDPQHLDIYFLFLT